MVCALSPESGNMLDPLAATRPEWRRATSLAVRAAARVTGRTEICAQFCLGTRAGSTPVMRHPGENPFVFAVADGFGPAGAKASASAIAALMDRVGADLVPGIPRTRERLLAAYAEANGRIAAMSGTRRPGEQGAVLTAAAMTGDALVVAHVGQARAYLLRGYRLVQLTVEHTVGAELVRFGVIPPERVGSVFEAGALTRYLGGTRQPSPDLLVRNIHRGDALVLVTSGVTRHLDATAMEATLASASGPNEACDALLERVTRAGGRQDAAVVVARFS